MIQALLLYGLLPVAVGAGLSLTNGLAGAIGIDTSPPSQVEEITGLTGSQIAIIAVATAAVVFVVATRKD